MHWLKLLIFEVSLTNVTPYMNCVPATNMWELSMKRRDVIPTKYVSKYRLHGSGHFVQEQMSQAFQSMWNEYCIGWCLLLPLETRTTFLWCHCMGALLALLALCEENRPPPPQVPGNDRSLWWHIYQSPGDRFKIAYQLLKLRAPKCSPLSKMHIFQCLG